MVKSMATTKITITLPDQQIEEIRQRVAAHESASVSGFVQRAVQKTLTNSSEFSAMIDQGLAETGGPLTPKERAWAEKMLSSKKRGTKKTKPGKAA
jgi:Arc/MetJ-type ribon-helix-helix transcriptional regulator